MSSASMLIKIVVVLLAVVLLSSIAVVLRNKMQAPVTRAANSAPRSEDAAPSCTGVSSPTSSGQAPEANPHPHSVSLSWNPAVPVSSSPRDAIKGYYVYRSLTSQTYSESYRISQAPLSTTHCIDTTVEPRKTYFYVVKTVTEAGVQSGSSGEIKAVVPFP